MGKSGAVMGVWPISGNLFLQGCTMRFFVAALAVAMMVFFSGCAGTLDNIVETHHQERIEQANANRMVTQGGSDGIGAAYSGQAMHVEK